MKGTLTLHSTKHSLRPLRTESVTGDADPIEVGERFFMLAESLSGVGTRVVSTSPVVRIIEQDEHKITFQTENSTYEFELKG